MRKINFNKQEKVLVSSCLLGTPCRWHGKKLYKSTYIKRLEQKYPNIKFISVCPEVLAGLGVPRKPVKRRRNRVFETCADKKERPFVTGKELTKEFELGAKKVLERCRRHKIEVAVLCNWSPSCGKGGITWQALIREGVTVINTF